MNSNLQTQKALWSTWVVLEPYSSQHQTGVDVYMHTCLCISAGACCRRTDVTCRIPSTQCNAVHICAHRELSKAQKAGERWRGSGEGAAASSVCLRCCVAAFTQAWEAQVRKRLKKPLVRSRGSGRKNKNWSSAHPDHGGSAYLDMHSFCKLYKIYSGIYPHFHGRG